ncbi:MAG: sulfotransferase [Algicola sp.]|nr:sulfotransferase [Algicola sp.]
MIDNTPFFLLGAARSGTTMLRLMLNRHSRLAIPFESHFLRLVFEKLPTERPFTSTEVNQMVDLIVTERNFSTWHLNPDEVRHTLLGLAPAPLNILVDALFHMEIAASKKPRWGDKTPVYYHCWQKLMALFPGSKLVHIIRDGRDVVRSLQQVGWHGPTADDRARYWLQRVEMAQEATRQLGPERNLIIQYEDLVLQTQATLKRLCDFLQESFEVAMLNFYEDSDHYISDIDGQVHGKLGRPPRPEDVHRWRTEMPQAEQMRFEAVAGKGLRLMSYPCRFS